MNDSCINRTIAWTGYGGLGGAFLGSMQSVWDSPTKTSDQLPSLRQQLRVISRFSVIFAASAAVYSGSECFAESVRQKKDFWNATIGGVGAGMVQGIVAGSLMRGIKSSAFLATAMGFSTYMLDGYEQPQDRWKEKRQHRFD